MHCLGGEGYIKCGPVEIPAAWHRPHNKEFQKSAGRGAGAGAGKTGGVGWRADTGADKLFCLCFSCQMMEAFLSPTLSRGLPLIPLISVKALNFR